MRLAAFYTVLILVLNLVKVSPAYSQQEEPAALQKRIDRQQQELKDIEEEIADYRKNAVFLGQREKQLKTSIDGIDKKLDAERRRSLQIKQDMDSVRNKISVLKQDLAGEKKKSRFYLSHINSFLGSYYIHKQRSKSLPWFSSLFCEVWNPCFYTGKIITEPVRRYSNVKREITKMVSTKEELEKSQASLISLQKELADLQNDYIKQKKTQLALYKNIRSERIKLQDELKSKEEEKSKLNTLIYSLKRKVQNIERLKILSEQFEQARGELPWPVAGKIVSSFGKQRHPELNTYVINRGIRIKTDSRDEVVEAVAGGEVVYADEFKGMGNIVVIDHGNDYYTVYGELGQLLVEPGGEIEPMAEIGRPKERVVYFELGHGTRPEDPVLWLEKKN